MVIEHAILDRKVVELRARIKEKIVSKRLEIIHLEAQETSYGELADRISCLVETEKRELVRLEAKL